MQGELFDRYWAYGSLIGNFRILCAKCDFRWSCHFDDDNYVNINSLKGFLKTIDASTPFYIGKSSTRQPLIVSSIDGDKKYLYYFFFQIFIRFATGGAGFCLSQRLLNSLRDSNMDLWFDALCEKYMLPDDVTIGHIITNLLHVPLTEVQEFHSHLENLNHLSAAEIRDQVRE
ncbi:unnamed protein product [Nippostrongylus brasiliensis]|uniref:Fringe glycosyltransferase (inferred by orthology to a D. melanogaster protein) n=1 Tax=Nippostrongylus brasiliensis TaxID=27835 RepID=A0A158R258_NIPBR|nr:unnamed protein product [Nippostrongylus brasiliensis]